MTQNPLLIVAYLLIAVIAATVLEVAICSLSIVYCVRCLCKERIPVNNNIRNTYNVKKVRRSKTPQRAM